MSRFLSDYCLAHPLDDSFCTRRTYAPCTAILSQDEWQTLFVHVTKQTHLPLEPPTAAQAVLWIACLGGFMARKGDGQPGVTAERWLDTTPRFSFHVEITPPFYPLQGA